MQIVARCQYHFDFLELGCVFILPINEERVIIVPIKAEKVPVLILSHLLHIGRLARSNRIELIVVFIRAYVVGQDSLFKLIVFVGRKSEDISDVPRIVYEFFSYCLFERKGHSKIPIIQVQWVVWRRVLVLVVL